MQPDSPPLLDVRNLTTTFETDEGVANAVDDVSFSLYKGETLGIVGESGCGKTVTAMSIMRLIRSPGHIAGGEIILNGRNLLDLTEREMRSVRGNEVGMVFQEAMTSLNPVFTIGDQLTEVSLYHRGSSWSDAYDCSVDMLARVGISDPHAVMTSYPHQLSGGMRQRALIAMGLVANPGLLILDEPTTAIDVTVQAQVLNLINDLKKEFGMTVLLITHDLGVVAEVCDRVAIMYASHIVECGTVHNIYHSPRHPYTLGLLASIPSFHLPKEILTIIPGQVPRPTNYPPGCNFHSRCNFATESCVIHEPTMTEMSSQHHIACWNWEDVTPPASLHRAGIGDRNCE
ncbi:MAG: peptide ABC transporter ATP-binding protein [Ignavibacteria bacterium]|nr:MAG: peptide ABC transporter ATP-binding protein [Ignavibacteria bacterium]